MENQKYVRTLKVDQKTEQTCLDVMNKYGNNHWWELVKSDPRTFAYYQLQEPVMLVKNFSQFHEAVETLLQRPVQSIEFASDALVAEARRAFPNKR